jgi:hypothetical protein
MVSWRSWLAVLLAALAVATACSGTSDAPPPKGKGGSAGQGGSVSGASGNGAAGRGGTAGRSSGGTAGFAEAGEGGVPIAPVGGSAGIHSVGGAGVGAMGGAPPSAGSAGIGGAGNGGFSGSGSFPPFNWTCPIPAWRDGSCHCGCGVADPDCKNGDIDTCDICNAIGSCSGAECSGRIDEDDTTKCRPVPNGWTCPARNYEDGSSCDCGCGIADPDCDGEGIDACDECAAIGSCAPRDCPSIIDPEDNSQCWLAPGWSCSTFDYGDGVCDCGCGTKDVDCPSLSAEDCEYCSHGCTFEACPVNIDPDNNAFCTTPPFSWACAARFYNDGTLCHCGCGAIDPDCEPIAAESCDTCNAEGSCSGQACPGTIHPMDIRYCLQPDPPPEWTCDSFPYADGSSCDCGCGAYDPDCRGTTTAACDSCWGCGGECPDRIDPTDISACLPPPVGWTCPDDRYWDYNYCDCGCGILDPDCGENSFDYCTECPTGSCSRSDCRDVDRTDITVCDGGLPAGWTCPPDYFGDLACDCGCGGADEDCAGPTIDACDFCDSPGSCSSATQGCPGTINPADNSVCAP